MLHRNNPYSIWKRVMIFRAYMIHRRNLHLLWNVIKWNVADLDFSCFLQSRQLKKVNSSCVVFNHYTIKHTHTHTHTHIAPLLQKFCRFLLVHNNYIFRGFHHIYIYIIVILLHFQFYLSSSLIFMCRYVARLQWYFECKVAVFSL